TQASGIFTSILAIAPLVIVSYFTFKSSMGRLEDENRHLADVNRLYLKVVETLAMAVDAKDQVTHGHVRRVQTYALQLARHLGVTDEQELRAIETAALLHDIGKLAVPEHILNKPGKLTAGEYERMKLHAPLGADMLSAVDFPYPVVPIVRHHHENWDGTGYPDGLHADGIPVGARVLSVVDCYDALRSHRPYRRALSPREALAIIRERRGTMYDPAVIDAFETIQTAIEAESVDDPLPEVFDRFAEAARGMRRTDPASDAIPLELRLSSTDMLLKLYGQLSTLGADADLVQTCDILLSAPRGDRRGSCGLRVGFRRSPREGRADARGTRRQRLGCGQRAFGHQRRLRPRSRHAPRQHRAQVPKRAQRTADDAEGLDRSRHAVLHPGERLPRRTASGDRTD
ncbi:MAG: HD-GYP domain-containing protein, partial [Acidobacteria bacterium]|nr:HD-GYP domain-containing protein [Acidobacteriota bacterium]